MGSERALTSNARGIADAIKRAHGWISAGELCITLGIPERQLRLAIHDMRRSGDPEIGCIISDSRGYKWTIDETEIDAICEKIDKHARRQLAAMSGVRRAAKRAQPAQGVLL